MVRTWRFHCQGLGSIPVQGIKIPYAVWCGQKKKKFLDVYAKHFTFKRWSLIPFFFLTT